MRFIAFSCFLDYFDAISCVCLIPIWAHRMAKKRAFSQVPTQPAGSHADWKGRSVALVTGASRGIGREYATVLARHGFDVVLVARDVDRLASVARELENGYAVRTLVLVMDLSRPNGAHDVYKRCEEKGIVPEILINNAGFGQYSPFAKVTREEHVEMLHVNVMTPLVLTSLFLPAMIERRKGFVQNVASTAGFQPGPIMANYYATKSYLISLSVALAEELAGTGVAVSVLCPGPTRTEFHARAGMSHTRAASFAISSARRVAEHGYREMMSGKTIIVPGIINKIGSVGVRLLPLLVAAKIVKRLHR